jgi:predicted RND superfamily exporter protein
VAKSNLTYYNATSDDRIPQKRCWEEFTQRVKDMSPREFKSIFVASKAWPKIESEEAYFQTYVQTVFLSVCFALCVLFLMIKNMTTSLIVFGCVAFVVNLTLFGAYLQEWEIGTLEMVAITVLLGLSVDYPVLMAVEYVESKLEYRNEKLAQVYKHIGISIIHAWATIFGVGMIQFGCKLPMGMKFVYILSTAASISMVSALFLFGALSHVLGYQKLPGDHWCHLVNLIRQKRQITPEEEEAAEPQDEDKPEPIYEDSKAPDKSFASRQERAY